jgi:hypothetical protein
MSRYLELLKKAEILEDLYHDQILQLESEANPSFLKVQSVNQIIREASMLKEEAKMITTEHGY